MVTVKLYKHTGLCMDVSVNPNISPMMYLNTFNINQYYSFQTKQLTNFSNLLVEKTYTECLDFDYCTIYSNNRYYCFWIDSIECVRDNKTKINLSLDYYHTYYDKVKIGTSYLIRSTVDEPYPQKVYGRTKVITLERKLSTNRAVYFIYRDNQANKNYLYYGAFEEDDCFDNFAEWFNLNVNNVVNAWIAPFTINAYQSYWETIISQDELHTINRIELDTFFYNYINGNHSYTTTISNVKIVDNDISGIGITDMHGNMIWSTYEYVGEQYKSITFYPILSVDTFKWLGVWENDLNSFDKMFIIPCENLSYFNDAYKDYEVMLKPFQRETRQAQMTAQLYKEIGQMGKETINWGGLGAVKGSGMTGLGMAGVGAAGQIVSSVINYYATQDLNNKLENIEDRQAKMQVDYLNSYGSAVTDITKNLKNVSLVLISNDNATVYKYNKQKAMVGKDYNYYLNFDSNIKSFVCLNKNEDFVQARVTVTDIPLAGINQIKSRFLNGLEFIYQYNPMGE